MNLSIGEALSHFNTALQRFSASAEDTPGLEEALFENGRTWVDLLTYKLLPQLGGDACLVVAVAGGTNTGKSAVFNSLVGASLSPAVATAAATRHPVLAANGRRSREALDGVLVSGFEPAAPGAANDILTEGAGPQVLYVAEAGGLPDNLVFLDTPDVDSIERSHWDLAEHIRAAGDVVLAVVTGEKYKDERVVGFFEQAVQAGRLVIPVMNKADSAYDYTVARRQLDSFCEDIGVNGPAAVAPLNPGRADANTLPLTLLDGGSLRDHLESLDAADVKRRVYHSTIARFLDESGAFLTCADALAERLRAALDEAARDVRELAEEYRPEFPQERCGLVHGYLQQRRQPLRRTFGQLGESLARALARGRRVLRGALLQSASTQAAKLSFDAAREANARQVRALTFTLIQRWQQRSATMPTPLDGRLNEGLASLDMDAMVPQVVRDVCNESGQEQSFHDHAREYLVRWCDAYAPLRWIWNGFDGAMAALPVFAVLLAGGLGGILPTLLFIVGWPVAQQVVFRALEYRYADRLLDFQSPWQEEQQETLVKALEQHIQTPVWKTLTRMNEVLEGDDLRAMHTWRETCRNT